MDFVSLGQTVFAGFANGSLYAFIGLGFGLISRSTGVINFAQGEFAMLGAVTTEIVAAQGVPLGFAVLVAVIFCGMVGGLFYLLALQHATRATMAQLIIMTIGFAILIRGAVTWGWGSDPIVVPPFTSGRPIDVFGVSILPQALWLIGTLITVTAAMWWFFRYTVTGLALRAGASNPMGAAFVGIDHKRLGALSFVAAGMLGGLGGAVWAPIAFAQVDLGVALGLKGFTAAALGGFGTTFGPIVGGLVFGLVESLAAGYLSSAYVEAISYGLLLVVLIARPQGLLGRRIRQGTEIGSEEVISSGIMRTRLTTSDGIKLLVGAVVLIALGQILGGAWLTTSIFAGITAIVVIGLVLLTGFAGQISLGQGTFMMIGAYASGYLTLRAGWPPLAAIGVGMVLSGAFAFVVGRFIFRLHGYYLAMASLSLLMIGLTLARELSFITGGPNGLPGIPPLTIFGQVFFTDEAFYYVVVAAALLCLLGAQSITRSRTGRALLAVRSDELAARSCGADVLGLKIGSLMFAAVTASLAGSLYVHYLGIANPAPFSFEASILQITALTLGGFLSLWGSFFGAAVVLALPSFIALVSGSATSQSSAGMQYLLYGLLLICVTLIQSNGQLRSMIPRFRLSVPFRRTVRQA